MSNLAASSKLAPGTKRLAPPSPSPSNASNASKTDGTPSKRQKRDGVAAASVRDNRGASPTPTPAAMAAANASYGNDMLTHLSYAVDFLKSKAAPKTLQEILDHLSLQHTPESQQQQFAALMRKHPRMLFTPAPRPKDGNKDKQQQQLSWKLGKYEFRPKIPGVKSKVALLEHLQAKTDASALAVKDLKDGWPDCDQAIDELEAEHRILVVRTRKENHAKFIWIDDPRLAHRVDPEFKAMWHRVEVPGVDDIVRKLTAVGQKPASEDPRLKKIETAAAKQKPKRRGNRGSKPQQNVHMSHLLQDYSSHRKG
ncbi:hypothetical protein DL768_008628 [Monosporascus sp. mg162]|nr:hypothetical protein DL768_008628 [Monosporascus sp. mg162]